LYLASRGWGKKEISAPLSEKPPFFGARGVIDFLLSSIAAAAQRSHVLNYLMALAQLW